MRHSPGHAGRRTRGREEFAVVGAAVGAGYTCCCFLSVRYSVSGEACAPGKHTIGMPVESVNHASTVSCTARHRQSPLDERRIILGMHKMVKGELPAFK